MSAGGSDRERSAEMRPARSLSCPGTQPLTEVRAGRRSQSATRLTEQPTLPSSLLFGDDTMMSALCAGFVSGATTAAVSAAPSRMTIGEEMVYAAQTLPELRARSVFVFGLRESTALHSEIARLLRELRSQCGSVTAALRLPCRPPFGIPRPSYTSALLLVVFNTVQGAEKAVRCAREGTLLQGTDSNGIAGDSAWGSAPVISIQPARQFALTSAEAETCLHLLVIPPNTLQGDDVCKTNEKKGNASQEMSNSGGTYTSNDASYNGGTSRTRTTTTTTIPLCGPNRLAALYSASARLWTLVLSPMAVQTVDWQAALAATARDDAYIVDELRAASIYLVTAGQDKRAATLRRRQRHRRRERQREAELRTTRDSTDESANQQYNDESRAVPTGTYSVNASGRGSRNDIDAGRSVTASGNDTPRYTSQKNYKSSIIPSAAKASYGMPAEAESAQARYYRERYGMRSAGSLMGCTNDGSTNTMRDGMGHAGEFMNRRQWPWAAASASDNAYTQSNVLVRTLRKGWQLLSESFQQHEDTLHYGDERLTNNNMNGYNEAPPPQRRRRVEGDEGSNAIAVSRKSDKKDDIVSAEGPHFPRLGTLGSRLAWLPGFHYVLPLFARSSTPDATKERSEASVKAGTTAADEKKTQSNGQVSVKAGDNRGCNGLTEAALAQRFTRNELNAPASALYNNAVGNEPCDVAPLLRGGVHYLAHAQPLRGLKRPYRTDEDEYNNCDNDTLWMTAGSRVTGEGNTLCDGKGTQPLSVSQRLRRTASRYLPFTVSLAPAAISNVHDGSIKEKMRAGLSSTTTPTAKAYTAYDTQQHTSATGKALHLPTTSMAPSRVTDAAEHEVSLPKRPFFTPLPSTHETKNVTGGSSKASARLTHHVTHHVVGDVHSADLHSSRTSAAPSTIRVLSVQTPSGSRISDAHFRSSRGLSDISATTTTHTFSASDAPTSSALSTSRSGVGGHTGARRQRRNVRFVVPSQH